jgi:hypothetical protein
MFNRNSKPRSFPRAVATAVALACMASVSMLAAGAYAAAPLLQPSTDHCLSDDMIVLNQTTPGDLPANERRVVLWLVHQILSAEHDGSRELVFTTAAASSALGIDVGALDRQRIQEHVRAMLVGHSCQRALELLD